MKTKETVLDLLQKSKSLRDSDNRLIANVWAKELGGKLKNMTAEDLLHFIADGKLSSAPTIKRIRAKLQQENEHLRGNTYKFKQVHAQKDWRKEMRKKEIYTFDKDWEAEVKINE